MHATTPEGILGGFEFTAFQRNLKEWQQRPWTYVRDRGSRVLQERNNSWFDSYSVRNSVLSISHITFLDCRGTFFPTTFLEIAEEVHLRSEGVGGGGEGEVVSV